MNLKEREARELCAFCNFVPGCSHCPHRIWPSGEWLKKPRFDWRECSDWKFYLPWKDKLINRIKERLKKVFG